MQTMREDAETILREAVAAAQPGRLVREALAAERLTGRIVLLAAGKAAWAMAQAACACVPVRRGIVITKDGHLGGALTPLELAEAGHPVPDARAFAAARRALALTQGLTAEDTVLVLLSGGASALFELPLVPEVRLREITQRLLRSGADIAAMNAVRKRLSAVKGGRFAQHCAPARVVSILLSDVLGDRPDVIGSGPAVPDPSTSGEALEAAGQAGLLPDAALEALLRQETPKMLENARWHVVGGVRLLCAAAEETCRRLGYAPFVLTDRLSCEAREAGRFLSCGPGTGACPAGGRRDRRPCDGQRPRRAEPRAGARGCAGAGGTFGRRRVQLRQRRHGRADGCRGRLCRRPDGGHSARSRPPGGGVAGR